MTNRFFSVMGVLAISASLVFSSALMADGAAIKLLMNVEKEVRSLDKNGKTILKYISPEEVLPGNTLLSTIRYSNEGRAEATDVVIANPLPKDLLYIDGSAKGDGTVITFSVDGGKIFAAADRLNVTSASGEKRAATAADYTHIRWLLQGVLAPKAEGFVLYKSRVK